MGMEKKRHYLAMDMLMIVTLIWGSGFMATELAIRSGLSAAWIMMLRFLVGALLVSLLFFSPSPSAEKAHAPAWHSGKDPALRSLSDSDVQPEPDHGLQLSPDHGDERGHDPVPVLDHHPETPGCPDLFAQSHDHDGSPVSDAPGLVPIPVRAR